MNIGPVVKVFIFPFYVIKSLALKHSNKMFCPCELHECVFVFVVSSVIIKDVFYLFFNSTTGFKKYFYNLNDRIILYNINF